MKNCCSYGAGAVGGRYCNAPPPPPPPSVCPSVTFSFCTVTQKRMAVFSWKLAGNVHQVLGVCCIVFDIDGMLLELFMNFLNIEKNKILRIFFCKISCFLRVSCYFPQWLGGGGGCNVFLTFYAIYNFSRKKFWEYKKRFFYFSFNVFFVFFYAGNIEKFPFTYWLNGEVVSPNSRYREFYHEIGNIGKCPSLTG